MRALLDRIEPSLGSEEENYRLAFLQTDKALARASVLITLALVFLVFTLELNFFGRQQFIPILLVRLIFFVFSLVVLVKIGRASCRERVFKDV